ncbi:MAG: ribosome biogenesis GTPase Der [Gammaproteobacteria bacterium]|nr:MAG: ribosome biogenesis GTPase Der [Gammaproteobacteria bacterium]
MLPVIALVGRPNVGKSTLFNRLTGSRDALVADYPGLTRDRLYAYAQFGERGVILIDTGGLGGGTDELDALVDRQVELAVAEADAVVLLVDARDGLTPGDAQVARRLRRSGKPCLLAVNKSEGQEAALALAEFHALGFDDAVAISATRGSGLGVLAQRLSAGLPAGKPGTPPAPAEGGTRIAVIGRPNVGKSTLINRYLGEERLLTQDRAGTTRDSIAVPLALDGRHFTLVDTAGIRRRARVTGAIEKFSILKSLQALEQSDAVILLLDARDGVTEQDLSLIGLVLERGRALALGVNKWDGLSESRRAALRRELDRRLPFLDFVDRHYVSARHGSNILPLLDSAARAAEAARSELPTPALNDVLQAAVQAQPPPVARRSRPRLSYAHQGGRCPPLIVIHGNQVERLPASYRRYLVNCFRKAFRLRGTPLRLELRSGENPYAGRRNRLTPRQQRRRRRLRRHARRR